MGRTLSGLPTVGVLAMAVLAACTDEVASPGTAATGSGGATSTKGSTTKGSTTIGGTSKGGGSGGTGGDTTADTETLTTATTSGAGGSGGDTVSTTGGGAGGGGETSTGTTTNSATTNSVITGSGGAASLPPCDAPVFRIAAGLAIDAGAAGATGDPEYDRECWETEDFQTRDCSFEGQVVSGVELPPSFLPGEYQRPAFNETEQLYLESGNALLSLSAGPFAEELQFWRDDTIFVNMVSRVVQDSDMGPVFAHRLVATKDGKLLLGVNSRYGTAEPIHLGEVTVTRGSGACKKRVTSECNLVTHDLEVAYGGEVFTVPAFTRMRIGRYEIITSENYALDGSCDESMFESSVFLLGWTDY